MFTLNIKNKTGGSSNNLFGFFYNIFSYIFTLNDESTKKVAESTKPHLASLDQRPVGGPADATQRLQR
jgi:hypothetical protein